MSNEVYDLQNRLREAMDMRRAAETAALLVIEKKGENIKKKREEETKKRETVSQELAKTKEELRNTKSRNSRLATENNRIKAGRKEPYKKPVAGEKGGKRAPRLMSPYTERPIKHTATTVVRYWAMRLRRARAF